MERHLTKTMIRNNLNKIAFVNNTYFAVWRNSTKVVTIQNVSVCLTKNINFLYKTAP